MENYKFIGEGQLYSILNQLNIDKTVFIQLAVFAIVFIIAKMTFLGRFSEVLAKRLEGTTYAKNKKDHALTKLESFKAKYESMRKAFQTSLNEEVRESNLLAQKSFEKNIVELKTILLKDIEGYRKKSEEETKNLLDDATSSVIEMKDKIVGKVLS